MKREVDVFCCDECAKEIYSIRSSGYPYTDGWKYIYNLALKFSDNDRVELHDKHFCSKSCLKTFLLKVLQEDK